MHIEIRERKGKKYYYLSHSARLPWGIRKFRKYLGKDLTKKEIIEKRAVWEAVILEQMTAGQKISDPLKAMLTKEELRLIDALIGKAKIEVRHLSETEWTRFSEAFTFNTNAIEGSTVTATEVKHIIEGNRWPQRKTGWEIAETYGVAEAIKHIRKTKTHLSPGLILKLHEIVFKNSKPYAGEFRNKGVEVAISDQRGNIIHRGAPQQKIKGLINELMLWYRKNKNVYHPVVLAAVVHNQFENIHPFQDGNGRVGRLLLNNILLKHGMPPLNIELKNRREYYEALQAYQKDGNLRPTIELMIKEYGKSKNTKSM